MIEEKLTLKTSGDQIVVSVTQAAKEEEPVVEEIIDEEN